MEFILGIVIVILDIIAILAILKSGQETLMKVVWIVVVIALPVIGMLLWFLIGAKKNVV